MFGAAYRAALEGATTTTMRLKEVVLRKRDFVL